MKEQLKVGMLGVIALTLIINTYYQSQQSGANNSGPAGKASIEKPKSNAMSKKQNNPDKPAPNFNKPDKKEPPKNITSVEFTENQHDFGAIKQKTTNEKVFKFTNTGENPLIIDKAKGSCGCTVPSYPKEPIAPGEEGEIEVVYKPGKQKGQQQKSVTITANTKPRQTVLKISADVQEI